MPNSTLNRSAIKDMIESASNKTFGVSAGELNKMQLYKCVATVVRDMLLQKRATFNHQYKARERKRVHYLSMEFLMGRSLKNNLFNMELDGLFAETLKKYYKVDIEDLYECEPDAGLGTADLDVLPHAISMRLLRKIIPLWDTLCVSNTGFSNKKSWTAGKRNCPTTGFPAAGLG